MGLYGSLPAPRPDKREALIHGYLCGQTGALFARRAIMGQVNPFRGMVVALSLSANRALSGTSFVRKTAFRREKVKKNFGPQETTRIVRQVMPAAQNNIIPTSLKTTHRTIIWRFPTHSCLKAAFVSSLIASGFSIVLAKPFPDSFSL